jgi:hypothetical protein
VTRPIESDAISVGLVASVLAGNLKKPIADVRVQVDAMVAAAGWNERALSDTALKKILGEFGF